MRRRRRLEQRIDDLIDDVCRGDAAGESSGAPGVPAEFAAFVSAPSKGNSIIQI